MDVIRTNFNNGRVAMITAEENGPTLFFCGNTANTLGEWSSWENVIQLLILDALKLVSLHISQLMDQLCCL